MRIIALGVKAGEDPEHFNSPYLKELQGYHEKRATKLGSRVTALEVEKPRFVRIRKWFTEKKQTYHDKRSRVAARKFVEFAFSEA